MPPLGGPNKNGNKNILSIIPRRDSNFDLMTSLSQSMDNYKGFNEKSINL